MHPSPHRVTRVSYPARQYVTQYDLMMVMVMVLNSAYTGPLRPSDRNPRVRPRNCPRRSTSSFIHPPADQNCPPAPPPTTPARTATHATRMTRRSINQDTRVQESPVTRSAR